MPNFSNAKYAKVGDRYITLGEGNQLQQITEQDIIGRRGTGGSLDLIRREGELIDLDPSQFSFGSGGEISYQGGALSLGGSAISAKPGTSTEDFGGLPFNQDFSKYLGETGQTYNPESGFSGGQTLGVDAPQYDATLGGSPKQTGGQFGDRSFGRVGTQVFETTGGQRRAITETEFNEKLKSQGLNLDVLPQLSPASAGQGEAEKTLADGATTTGLLGGEQKDFFKNIETRMAKTDEMISKLLVAGEKSEEEKKLKKTAEGIASSYESGLTDIYGQVIPMQLILGQGQELQRQANDKLNAVNRTLERLKDNRDAQEKVLQKAYDLSRQSIQDAISFYKLTAPEKLAFDSDTGTVIMQNPMTGEVYKAQVPGWSGGGKPSEVKEYDYLQSHNLLPSSITNYSQYVQWKAQQYGTEGTNDYTKELNSQVEAIYNGDYGKEGSREKAIARLQGMFPGKNVAADIYNRVPSGYESNITPKQTSLVQKAGRLQELLTKSNNGQNLDLLTPAEQAELYSLI